MKTKLNLAATLALALHLMPGVVLATSQDGYQVTEPPAYPLFNTNTPPAWVWTNGNSVVWTAGGSGLTTNNWSGAPAIGYPDSMAGAPYTAKYRLIESAVGSPFEHIKPEYYLGDQITPPTNAVNWEATFARLITSPAYSNNAVFYDASVPGIFFCEGGLAQVTWVFADGSSTTNNYQVGGVSRQKPFRIFWTDEPFNSPPVDLTGKFVKFFGDPDIINLGYGMVTNNSGGMPSIVSNVVKGLFLDTATHWLQALGGINGHVVMAYYRSGNYNDLLGTIVVEVCAPNTKVWPGEIGGQLKPTGAGFDVVGLSALVTEGMTSDDAVGPYLYQHKGNHSYSPNNGSLYAIRKTAGEPWKIEVYWRQKDLMGTSWPFEILQYECDWPADATTYVRGQAADTNGTINTGLTIPIPAAYTSKLMEFQEPAGHAVLANSTFSTTDSGYSLLKLTGTDDQGDDNVWFLPIQSILRDDPQFDLTSLDWPVGVEVAPLPTAIALEFDGASAYFEAPITNQLNGSFTVESYFQCAPTTNLQTLFFKNAVSSNVAGWLDFQVQIGTQGLVQAILGSASNGVNAAMNVAANPVVFGDPRWHHLALVYDQLATNCTLYLDGAPTVVPLTYPRPASHAGMLYIGMDPTSNTPHYFNGKVDDIRVWDRALSATDITNSRTGFLHTIKTNANLVAYYPIDDGLGRVITDASDNGHDGLMVNCIRVASGALGQADVTAFSKYHGYIYEAVSGNNYNTNLYARPDVTTSNAITPESYIFAINKTPTNGNPLEIWWSQEVLQTAMPAPLWFPSWVQRYQFSWLTEAYAYPTIVLASQLGSANQSLVKRGVALDFSRSLNSKMKVDPGAWFTEATYTVECWVKPHNLGTTGQVFDFGNEGSTNRVALTILADGHIQYAVSGAGAENQVLISPTNAPVLRLGWNHLALVVSNGQATVYQDGHTVTGSSDTVPFWTGVTTHNYLAAGGQTGSTNSLDGAIDEFIIWGVARSQNEIYGDMLTPLTGSELDLRLYYSFDDDASYTPNAEHAFDLVAGTKATITYADWTFPGAPQLDRGVLMASDAPFVYYQNNPVLPGFNPNEEHAFVEASEGGYVTYALRCDLNNESISEPYVLVQYNNPNNNNRPNMAVYQVVPTNQVYPVFAGTMTAGTLASGPHPFDFLPNPWNTNTYWLYENVRNSANGVGYRDRKLQIWAKCAGPTGTTAELEMHNFYPMQDGFNFPSLRTQPALGTPVPWLCRLKLADADPLVGDPIPWTWTVAWPANTPLIQIGQTLTKATEGLPEVWGAKSMKLLYEPQMNSVALYDPVVIQTAELSFVDAFTDYFGFTSGPHGNTQQKNGNTYFKGVPPNVSDRFYFDPAAPKTACLKLMGRLVEHTGGLSYLQLNVLSDAERTVLKGLATANTSAWENAITSLAQERKNTDDAHAVVNYALTHMGPGAGPGSFVTLIENDATNPVFNVNAGDPIQMHIIQLDTNLFAGAVLPLEDPSDLLSEQLDILYTESFAGNASDYIFEWKRAEPNANGTTPTDYLHQYSLYLSAEGTTRFTIGKEGDTLPDMVNNFYVMRYRATSNSPVYAVTGDTWSDWVGPTLAEGWVERVLNNVTPFTQRMQDLYNNPAETTGSMIQQAGAPYEGDVALNQDNLTSVGLIQLYQTILNKAESMSLTLGINNTAANQQLMLAATRLNDLYMLLGNEAYADAMDPTIGFGADFINSQAYSLGGVDYGALSSSLFCFDNLVPSLREEELGLLRGRSDELAPSLQLSPTYNRLYWNFSKGVTAGEVAYAMNYQIQGDDATIDQPQAAALYPQGHGDAWGHYLSALTGYYRLLRNPYFSWGTPSITPMMVGDAVVDADYYDEEKFAESAAAMARTSVEIIKRTCEKSYVENSATPLAGYFDSDTNRAFGYGEWGARAGLSALYNWAAANSLLPPESNPLSYDFLTFATNTQLGCLSPSSKIDFSADFTIEFNIKPDAALQNASGNCVLFDWHANGATRADAGAISLYLDLQSSNLCLQVMGVTNNLITTLPPFNEWTHVAITYSAATSQVTFLLNGVQHSAFSNVAIPDTVKLVNPVIYLAANDSPTPFSGALSEFRIWNVVRTPASLVAARNGVSVNAAGLLMYQRFIANSPGAYLEDEASSASWMAEHPVWQKQSAAGVALNFTDNSILRITRDSVGSLTEVCTAIKDIQHNVDLADASMTPLGLSGNAIPFDIDPAQLASGMSHFEQIEQRAEQALVNAATLLDRAQSVSKLQRQQTQSAINTAQDLANEEAAVNIQLIGIFGYPYAADIGAGGTYPQGYDGPDIYHYMWMDLNAYGFHDFELEPKKSTVYVVNGLLFKANKSETLTLNFDLAANGMIIKPDNMAGTRRAQGRLQAAYGSFIQAYLDYRKALNAYDEQAEYCQAEAKWAGAKIGILTGLEAAGTALKIFEIANGIAVYAELMIKNGLDIEKQTAELAEKEALAAVPGVVIAGLADGTDIGPPIRATLTTPIAMPIVIAKTAIAEGKYRIKISEQKEKILTVIYEILKDAAELTFESHETVAEVEKLVMESNEAAMDLDIANAALINAQETYNSVLSEGEQLLSTRERLRKQAVNRIGAGRYQDMAFRTFRSDALAKYGNAFDLAKKYTYLATKAYDYETALGLSNDYGSDSIFGEIVGARTIGFMDNGVAQLGGLHGDGGLADILARLKANWLVLKGRLGINNPQIEQCWLSLRSECFRIQPAGTIATKAWQDKLSSFQVNDLLASPEFRRYCLSFQSSIPGGLLPQEPALVIPFSTSIDFARNVFGWPLAGNDHAFDSSYYATKIAKIGVKFIGYNNTTSAVVALSATPRVYLIPVGNDVMRSPGNNGGDLLSYTVVDQVVPQPFPLGTSTIDNPDWTAIYNAYTGSGDPLATIRRYPSLRAYYDQSADADAMLSNTRLVGRSVWNTRWLLIIPAGTLNADRTFALDTLIRGADFNKDGIIDQPGIMDIQIGFETYSNSGN